MDDGTSLGQRLSGGWHDPYGQGLRRPGHGNQPTKALGGCCSDGAADRTVTGRPVPADVPRAIHASGFGSLLLLSFAGTGRPITVLRSDELPPEPCASLGRAAVQGQALFRARQRSKEKRPRGASVALACRKLTASGPA